jgi:hypothetical protein
MRPRFARFVYLSRLPFVLAVLFLAAMTSLPADSRAAAGCNSRACDVQYYYDAARTQPAGVCYGACYPGGAVCYGDWGTDYFSRSNCEPCGC